MSSSDRDLFELEELAVQPGTYFNPQTEVVVVVDDSYSVDPEVFDSDVDSDWVRISDEVPIDEQARDEAFEEFRARRQPEQSDEDFEELEEELEPDQDRPPED